MFTRMFTGNVYYVCYCSVDSGKFIFWATETNGWWQKCTSFQCKKFSFLPILKAIKAVSCITSFGVSTAIITSFVSGISWILDSSMKAANCNTKLTRKFISVAVYSILFYNNFTSTEEEEFSMSKFQLFKLIIPCLNHI